MWPDSGDRCLLSDSHIQAIPHLQSWWGSPTSPNFIIQLAMVAAIFLAHLLHSVSRRVMIGGFCQAATYNPSPHLQSWCDSPTSPSFTIQLAMRSTVLLARLLHSIRRRVVIGGFRQAATHNPSPCLQSWCDSPTLPSFIIQLEMAPTALLAHLLYSIRRRAVIYGFRRAATYNPSPHLQSWWDSPTSLSFIISVGDRIDYRLC